MRLAEGTMTGRMAGEKWQPEGSANLDMMRSF
jgi:hypothetical protein